MKTPVKVSMKVQRILGAFSSVSIWDVSHLLVYYWEIGLSLIFIFVWVAEGVWNISNRKYHVSVYFLRKVIPLSFSVQGKNAMLVGRNTNFPDSTRKIMSRRGLFEKSIFSEHSKKISHFHIFF